MSAKDPYVILALVIASSFHATQLQMGLDAGPLEPLQQKGIKKIENGKASGLHFSISRLNFKACILVDNRIRLSNGNFKKRFCLDIEEERKEKKKTREDRDKDVTPETIPEYLKEKGILHSSFPFLFLYTCEPQFLKISSHPNYLHRVSIRNLHLSFPKQDISRILQFQEILSIEGAKVETE